MTREPQISLTLSSPFELICKPDQEPPAPGTRQKVTAGPRGRLDLPAGAMQWPRASHGLQNSRGHLQVPSSQRGPLPCWLLAGSLDEARVVANLPARPGTACSPSQEPWQPSWRISSDPNYLANAGAAAACSIPHVAKGAAGPGCLLGKPIHLRKKTRFSGERRSWWDFVLPFG